MFNNIGKKAKGGIVAAAMIVVIAAASCGGRGSAKTAEDFGITQSTAESGQITKVVNGTGSIAPDDSIAVNVPVGAKVLEVFVEDGDHIEKGDRIAKFDSLSLKEIMISLDESIDLQNDAIEELDPEEKNYQEKLDIAKAKVADLKESREKAAKLAKDPVLVADFSGVISGLNLVEGEKVTQTLPGGGNTGTLDANFLSTLLTGSNAAQSPAFTVKEFTLTGQEISLPETEGESFTLPEKKAIDQEETTVPEQTQAAASEEQETTLPAETEVVTEQKAADGEEEVSETQSETVIEQDTAASLSSSNSDNTANQNKEAVVKAAAQQTEPAAALIEIPFKTIQLTLASPAAGAVPQNAIALPENGHVKAAIAWVPASERFVSGSVNIAVIALQADQGYCFPETANMPEVTIDSCKNARIGKYDINGDGHADTIMAICPYIIPPDTGDTDEAIKKLNELAEKEMKTLREKLEEQINLLIKNVAGSASKNVAEVLKALGSGSAFSGMDLSSLAGSAFSGMDLSSLSGFSTGDLGDLSSLTGGNTSSSSYYEAAAIHVIPDEKVYLDISIDEMDINTIEVGQIAEVTVDAISGEKYEGEIVKIASTKSSETSLTGGNASAKYAVRICLPWDANMKFGMSASAKISVDTREDVIIVPIDAVMDLGGEDVVYTSFDQEGNLTDPVPVKIGLSDGVMAEILEGLSAGDPICYMDTQYESLFSQFETVELE